MFACTLYTLPRPRASFTTEEARWPALQAQDHHITEWDYQFGGGLGLGTREGLFLVSSDYPIVFYLKKLFSIRI